MVGELLKKQETDGKYVACICAGMITHTHTHNQITILYSSVVKSEVSYNH